MAIKNRLRAPLMFAFRAAHAAKDTKKQIDERNEAGERVLAGRRSSLRSVITEQALRREVEIDLENLLNATQLSAAQDMSDCDQARKSIINYGLPDVAHRTVDESQVSDIVGEIREALFHYEPRLDESTIHVSRDRKIKPEDLKVRFIVRADLYCDPVNIPIEFTADVQLDTTKIVIQRV